MKIVFIRHAEPDYSIDSLTERGWQEADLLADRIENLPADAYYCSPLGRAKDTAKESMRRLKKTYEILDWLEEFPARVPDVDTGKERIPWNFLPSYWTKVDDYYKSDKWYDTDIMKKGEVHGAYDRICKGMDELLEKYGYIRDGRVYRTESGNEKTIVIFCHMAMQLVAISYLTGLPTLPLWQNFFIAPTGISVLCTEEREKGIASFRCKMLGDISHLYAKNEKASDSGFFNEVFKETED